MKSPYPTPDIGGAMLRPGISEMYEDACYLWYAIQPERWRRPCDWPRLEIAPLRNARAATVFPRSRCAFSFEPGDHYAGGRLELDRGDLEDDADDDERWHADAEGERPEWLDEDMDGGHITYELCRMGDALHWGLRRGIWPGQPFAVYIGQPVWDEFSYTGDYDMTTDVRVVRIEPSTVTLREMEALLVALEDARAHAAALQNDIRAAQRVMTDELDLVVNHGPRYFSLALYSRIGHQWCLHQGRVEMTKQSYGWGFADADVDAAVEKLRATVRGWNAAALQRVDELLELRGVPGWTRRQMLRREAG